MCKPEGILLHTTTIMYNTTIHRRIMSSNVLLTSYESTGLQTIITYVYIVHLLSFLCIIWHIPSLMTLYLIYRYSPRLSDINMHALTEYLYAMCKEWLMIKVLFTNERYRDYRFPCNCKHTFYVALDVSIIVN